MSHLLNNSLGYNGNCRVKRDGVVQNFTQHEIEEYVKCSRDPSYFARKYIKVISVDKGTVPFDLYPYQEKMYESFTNNRFNIVLACRQSGKCHSINTRILIKNKHTGNEERLTIGEFHRRIAKGLQDDSCGIDTKETSLTSTAQGELGKNLAPQQGNTNYCRGSSGSDDRSIQVSAGLSDTVERKFIETYEVNDYDIWTDTGWESIQQSNKTIEYERFEVTLEDDRVLRVADTHIFFNENFAEVFAKDSHDQFLITEDGPKRVISVRATGIYENMYDISVDSENHRYYGDGVLSHNSTAVMGYLLWYALFHSEKNVAIAANKGAMAREILARITFALENLPFFLQPGCKTLNKGSIHFSNDTKIIACSTSSSALRGESVSCVTSDAKVTIEDDFGGIHFGEISNFINKSEFIETMKTYKYHVVYKTINLVNNKIYIGYHSTNNINDTYLGSGKWLRRAVEKYGPENFKREILHIFEDRETALKKEVELVDQTFVKRDDTYNLVPGGGTCILCGPDHGFYGKKHSPETLKKISDNLRNSAVERFANYTPEEHEDLMKRIHTPEAKKKRSMSLKGQKKSAEHVDKINRNPEKIRKTAEKHRGMKRSTEARMKMSISAKKRGPANKGKVYCYDPNSKQTRVCLLEEIPKGWIRGFRPKEK